MSAAETVALVNAARGLLKEGDAVGAARVLAPVITQLRSDPDALHLMGLVKRAQNDLDAAERYFRAAIAHALSDGGYYNDLGAVLQARGALKEAERVFRAAIALAPRAETARVNLVHCLLAQNELAAAEHEARAYIAFAPGAESWMLLSQVHRAQERHEQALGAAAAALECEPSMRPLKINYAGALDRAGRPAEALHIFEELAAKQLDNPDFALSFARLLFQQNRPDDAETVLRAGLKQWPRATALHSALARMRMLRGEGADAAAPLIEVLAGAADDVPLRLACADALHRGGFHAEALGVLEEGLRLTPDDAALLTASGFVLDEMNRLDEALKALRRVAALAPASRTALRNMLSTLLRARQPDEALRTVRGLRAEEPDEQYLIATEAMALRLLGDRAYEALYDYETYVRAYEASPPPGFFTAENYHAALAEVLRRQHRVSAHPLDQLSPHASQTGRSLLTLDDPAIKAFLATIDAAVRDYISRLKAAASDPVGRRKTDRFRFSGLWSTRLTDGGAIPNHVHDRGWISSAYYVAIKGAERPKDGRHGWLKFGEPARATPGLTAQKLLEPRVGLLVLFPSYMWHGVTPFEGVERLSLAFDVTPA